MVSGSGTNLQSILDAVAAGELPLDIAAVGADKPCLGIERAPGGGCIPPSWCSPATTPTAPPWNRALEERSLPDPDYIVFAASCALLTRSWSSVSATALLTPTPPCCPPFPGAHGVRDALAHGVKITGLTVHFVDAGVDTGPILAQAAVPVLDDDTERPCTNALRLERGADHRVSLNHLGADPTALNPSALHLTANSAH